MRLIFNELTITDFKALRGTHKLRLDLPGVTYLFGENKVTHSLAGNGAAKSTIWDALIWCLYGRTPLGLRNTDVKPWAGGKTAVSVKFTIGKKQHVIERATSPNSFTHNGQDIADARDIIGVSFELAVNTLLLPQDTELFLNRTPSDKMKLLTETLSLERWDTRSKAASTEVAALEKEVSALEYDATSIQGSIDEVERSLASIKALASGWADKARNRVRASAKDLSALTKRRDALDKRLATATLKEDRALTELKALELGLAKQRKELSFRQAKVATLEAQGAVLVRSLAKIELEVEALAEAKHCPTCGQKIKAADLDKHKTELNRCADQTDAEISSKAQERNKLVQEYQKHKEAITANEKFAASFDIDAREAGDEILRVRPELAELSRQIAAMSAPVTEDNPYTAQITDLTTRRKNLAREGREIETQLDLVRAKSEHNRFWIKGFKDVKLQLIEDVLSELELVSNSMIEEVGLDDWQIKFSIEKESKTGSIQNMINVEIVSPESNGKAVKWESYSGGEKQRLRLVGSLALADVLLGHAGVETNLEVLDEPAVYWASEGVQELVAYLAYRAREQEKSIYFIEHSAVESVHFARVWTVVKGKSGAKVIQ